MLASNNELHGTLSHAVLSGERADELPCCVPFSNRDDLLEDEFRGSRTTGYAHVTHVLGLASQIQVPDVHADISMAGVQNMSRARVAVYENPHGAGSIHVSSVNAVVGSVRMSGVVDTVIGSRDGGSGDQSLSFTGHISETLRRRPGSPPPSLVMSTAQTARLNRLTASVFAAHDDDYTLLGLT